MRKILIIAALLFIALAAKSQHYITTNGRIILESGSIAQHYITTNGRIILESGSIAQHNTPDIYVGFTYSAFQDSYIANLTLTKPSAGADAIYTEFNIRYTKAEIDAFTGSGTGDTEKVQDAVMQAVAATLLVINPTITFTII